MQCAQEQKYNNRAMFRKRLNALDFF